MAFPVLILDAPSPPLLHDEIERCLAYGLEITLNLHYFADQTVSRRTTPGAFSSWISIATTRLH